MMTDIVVTQADRAMAEMWDIECRHCSEYDGDYRADLAEAFASHRQAAAEEVERLREALIAAESWLEYEPPLRGSAYGRLMRRIKAALTGDKQ